MSMFPAYPKFRAENPKSKPRNGDEEEKVTLRGESRSGRVRVDSNWPQL